MKRKRQTNAAPRTYYDVLWEAMDAVRRKWRRKARRLCEEAAEIAAQQGRWRKVALLECALRALEGATQRA